MHNEVNRPQTHLLGKSHSQNYKEGEVGSRLRSRVVRYLGVPGPVIAMTRLGVLLGTRAKADDSGFHHNIDQ